MWKTRNRRSTFSVGKDYHDKAIITKDITNFEALVKVQIYEVEVNWCYVEAFSSKLDN